MPLFRGNSEKSTSPLQEIARYPNLDGADPWRVAGCLPPTKL